MKKTKAQKGITLIALIITIVVLLILAVVAITAIQDEDLIGKANSAVTKYNESVANEATQLGNYADYLSQYLPGGASATWTYTQSGAIVTGTSSNGETIQIPVGTTITNYDAGVTGYNSGWKLLGVAEGRLLIMSAANVDTVLLNPAVDYANGVDTGSGRLNTIAEAYGNGQFADGARSVKKADIEAVGTVSNGTPAYSLLYENTEDGTTNAYWTADGGSEEVWDPDQGPITAYGWYSMSGYSTVSFRGAASSDSAQSYFTKGVRAVVVLEAGVKISTTGELSK